MTNSIYIDDMGVVWPQKVIQEKSAMFIKVLNDTKLSCIIFYNKMLQYSQYTYCLHGNQHSLVSGYLYQNVPIFPLYMLLIKRIDTMLSKGINTFWCGGFVTF